MQERPSLLTEFAGCLDCTVLGYRVRGGRAGSDVLCADKPRPMGAIAYGGFQFTSADRRDGVWSLAKI
jgi:hypothetical protein